MDTPRSETDSASRPGPSPVGATGQGRKFPATRWTLVVEAREGNEKDRHRALAELCSMYWYPVYAFVRLRGKSSADAEDLTQGFFEYILSRGFAEWLARARGRLRSYLLGTLKNYLAGDRDRRHAQKRGGGATHLSIEWELAEQRFRNEPRTATTPETMYERAWAFSLLDRAFTRLRDEFADTRHESLFEDLQGEVSGFGERVDFPTLAARHSMSEGAVRVALHRMRKRFTALLREEIAETVTSKDEIPDEIQHLYAVFSS